MILYSFPLACGSSRCQLKQPEPTTGLSHAGDGRGQWIGLARRPRRPAPAGFLR